MVDAVRPSLTVVSCFVLLLLTFCESSSGAIILDDAFAYNNGPLVTVAGGMWTTHSGTTGEVNVANSEVFLTEDEREDVSALLINQPYTTAAGAVLFARFKMTCTALPSGQGAYFAHFRGGSTFRGRVFVTGTGAPAGKFKLGIANGGALSDIVYPATLSLNQPYTVVLRYAVSQATTTLWLSPALDSDPSVTATDPVTGISISSFSLRQSLSSSDGMGDLIVDDLRVGTHFSDVAVPPLTGPPVIIEQPEAARVNEGATVTMTANVGGSMPMSFQWRRNGIEIPAATNLTLTFSNLVAADSGSYVLWTRNAFGSAVTQPANVEVIPLVVRGPLMVLAYNVHGNGVADFSTNAAQVQAIGRQVALLRPDVVAFNEIPYGQTYQMQSFANAYLPGYALATNSGTDGFIRSVVLSRFPIRRTQRWLQGSDLSAFGSSGRFARDLFEVEISVPQFPEPVHIFVAHLKAFSDAENATQRAAEAGAVSNFFVTSFLRNFPSRPYALVGDLNEDVNRPPPASGQPIQRLVNDATGLRLTTPLNLTTSDDRTLSSTAPSVRFDYILPNGLLFSNILHSQVFRSDVLTPTPGGIQAGDSQLASDHLPVLMTFNNPYRTGFRFRIVGRGPDGLTLGWETVSGRSYRVELSDDLFHWTETLNVPGSGTVMTYFLPNAGRQGYIRVREQF